MIGSSGRDEIRINKCSAWVMGRIITPLTDRQTWRKSTFRREDKLSVGHKGLDFMEIKFGLSRQLGI